MGSCPAAVYSIENQSCCNKQTIIRTVQTWDGQHKHQCEKLSLHQQIKIIYEHNSKNRATSPTVGNEVGAHV